MCPVSLRLTRERERERGHGPQLHEAFNRVHSNFAAYTITVKLLASLHPYWWTEANKQFRIKKTLHVRPQTSTKKDFRIFVNSFSNISPWFYLSNRSIKKKKKKKKRTYSVIVYMVVLDFVAVCIISLTFSLIILMYLDWFGWLIDTFINLDYSMERFDISIKMLHISI